MSLTVAKADNLVLDGGAVTWPPALDLAGIHRRPMDILPNNGMGRGRCARYGALNLPVCDPLGEGGKRFRWVIPRLHFQHRPVDCRAVESRRGAGLQPAKRKTGALQRPRKPRGGRLADPTSRNFALADVNKPTEKSAGRQHDCGRIEAAAVSQPHAGDAIVAEQIVDFALDDCEILLVMQRVLHRRRVKLPVSLGARTAHSRPLTAIEHTELNAGGIGDSAHQAIQRINLAHQMPLAEPANGGIAGHRADGGEPLRDQRGTRAHPRSGSSGFAAGMAATDDNHIETDVHRILRSRELVAAARSAVKRRVSRETLAFSSKSAGRSGRC